MNKSYSLEKLLGFVWILLGSYLGGLYLYKIITAGLTYGFGVLLSSFAFGFFEYLFIVGSMFSLGYLFLKGSRSRFLTVLSLINLCVGIFAIYGSVGFLIGRWDLISYVPFGVLEGTLVMFLSAFSLWGIGANANSGEFTYVPQKGPASIWTVVGSLGFLFFGVLCFFAISASFSTSELAGLGVFPFLLGIPGIFLPSLGMVILGKKMRSGSSWGSSLFLSAAGFLVGVLVITVSISVAVEEESFDVFSLIFPLVGTGLTALSAKSFSDIRKRRNKIS